MSKLFFFPTPSVPFNYRSVLPRFSAAATVSSSSINSDVIIIGAGLSGLSAAVHLQSNGIPSLILESSDDVGGRVRTDNVSGFLLDRGFQIFLTAYPEAQRLLDYSSLDLKPFYPGALVYYKQNLHRVADPFRRPIDGINSLTNPIGSIPDKFLIGLNRIAASATPFFDLLTGEETSISKRLINSGFSPAVIDRFFRPFLGGIFFDTQLETSSRLLDFVLKCLAVGDNALPAGGIAAMPRQLASRLPANSIRFDSRVLSISSGFPPVIKLESGEIVSAHRGVIVAVDQPEANRLLRQLLNQHSGPVRPARSTVCLYFSSDRPVVDEPVLILNGSGQGIVNNMCFPSNVAPSYAPKGKTLVSVSLVGDHSERSDENLMGEVVRELACWFGSEAVGSWQHLRTYRIGFAQPDQTPPTNLVRKEHRLAKGIYVCGDHRTSATFDGALVSGRLAAEALIDDTALAIAP